LSSTKASAQQLWFSPGDDLEVKGIVTHPDYPKLFMGDDTWPIGRSHVDVLQARAPYFLRMPDDRTATIVRYLKDHKIKLGITLPLMPAETCGSGIEGILPLRGVEANVRGMKNKNVEV